MIYTADYARKIMNSKETFREEPSISQDSLISIEAHFRDVVTPRLINAFNQSIERQVFKPYSENDYLFATLFSSQIFYSHHDDYRLLESFRDSPYFDVPDMGRYVRLLSSSSSYKKLFTPFFSQVERAGFKVKSVSVKDYSSIHTLTVFVEFTFPKKGE